MALRTPDPDGASILGTVTRRASFEFTGAIRRYGLTADDIVMEGMARLLTTGSDTGVVPTKELLWWAAHKAGLDMIRTSARRAGQRAPERRNRSWGTVTAGDEAGLAQLRRSLDEPTGRLVHLTAEDGRPIEEPATEDELGCPDELAWEAICWDLVADRIRRQIAVRNRGGAGRRDARARFAALSDRVAHEVACRAAADIEVRRAYAEQPGMTAWIVAREIAPDQAGWYVADRFPPRSQAGQRRRAFRLVRRVVTTLAAAHGVVQARVPADDEIKAS